MQACKGGTLDNFFTNQVLHMHTDACCIRECKYAGISTENKKRLGMGSMEQPFLGTVNINHD